MAKIKNTLPQYEMNKTTKVENLALLCVAGNLNVHGDIEIGSAKQFKRKWLLQSEASIYSQISDQSPQ